MLIEWQGQIEHLHILVNPPAVSIRDLWIHTSRLGIHHKTESFLCGHQKMEQDIDKLYGSDLKVDLTLVNSVRVGPCIQVKFMHGK